KIKTIQRVTYGEAKRIRRKQCPTIPKQFTTETSYAHTASKTKHTHNINDRQTNNTEKTTSQQATAQNKYEKQTVTNTTENNKQQQNKLQDKIPE
ncbi:hypothetical protein, partial [Acinetobacter baumannii]|uniref:hypothetical protein n=1 Tax=Acinetobacter baumannii TaxID=470 RepID=UPI001C07A2AB